SVLIEAYRFLARLAPAFSPRERRAIQRLQLWTEQGWTQQRPLYAAEDAALADALAHEAPVWRAPCAVNTLGLLPSILGVTIVNPENCAVAGANAASLVE